MAFCNAPHPMHSSQVRCDEPRGHDGDHFHSFFMRSWERDDPTWIVTVDTYTQGGALVGGGPVTVVAPTQAAAVNAAIASERDTWAMPRARVEVRRVEREDGLRYSTLVRQRSDHQRPSEGQAATIGTLAENDRQGRSLGSSRDMFRYARTEKVRLRFGPPDTVNVYRCSEDGDELRLVKSWHGSAPSGAIVAPCGHTFPFGRAADTTGVLR